MKHQSPVAIFTSTEGHLSLAEASKEVFDRAGYQTVMFQEIDSLFGIYIFLYQFLPSVSGIFFRMSQKPSFTHWVRHFCEKRYEQQLIEFIDRHHPCLLINTYFMYIPTLEAMAAKYHIPLINVLPDPKTVHPLLVSTKADLNLAFDQTTVDVVTAAFPNQKITIEPMGWLVRDRFETDYDQHQIRTDLNLIPNIFTLLVAAGSDGTNHVLKILPPLLQLKTEANVIVACGHNQALLASVKALNKVWATQAPNIHLVPLAFTTNLHQYMQAADLVVGKAGPNSLFETVACRRPFFAITHISGQEDGNLDLIEEYTLGYVEEHPGRAAKILKSVIEQPTELNRFKQPLEKLAKYNRTTKTKLLARAETLINHDV